MWSSDSTNWAEPIRRPGLQCVGQYLAGKPEFLYVDERGLLVLTDHGVERVETPEEA